MSLKAQDDDDDDDFLSNIQFTVVEKKTENIHIKKLESETFFKQKN